MTNNNPRIAAYIKADQEMFGSSINTVGDKYSIATTGADSGTLITQLANVVKRYVSVSVPESFLNIPTITKAYNSVIYDASKGELNLLNDAGNLVSVKDGKATAAICRVFGAFLKDSLYDTIAAMGDNAKDGMRVYNAVYEAFMLEVSLNRQPLSVETEIDIFADKSSIEFRNGGDYKVRLMHHNFEPSERVHDNSVVAEVVNDWADHFKNWGDFVDSLVYSRFSSTRRKSFLWMNAPSSFGKGLMIAALEDIGIVYDMKMGNLVKCMSGDAVGIKPEKLLKAWVLSVDEWNSPKAELKLLNDRLTVSPKNKMEVTVPLYLKLFTSKEDVQKLTSGGIEKQFDERFFAFIYGNNCGRVEDRSVFVKYGDIVYRQAIATWLAGEINKRVADLRAMGKQDAMKFASEQMARIQDEFKLSASFGSLDDTKAECSVDMRLHIRDAMKGVFGTSRSQSEFYNVVREKVASKWLSTVDASGKRKRENVYVVLSTDMTAIVRGYLSWKYNNNPMFGKLIISSTDIGKKVDFYHGDKNRYELYDSPDAKSSDRKKTWGFAFPKDPVLGEVDGDEGKFVFEHLSK